MEMESDTLRTMLEKLPAVPRLQCIVRLARRVLPLWEAYYPGDGRPRRAIDEADRLNQALPKRVDHAGLRAARAVAKEADDAGNLCADSVAANAAHLAAAVLSAVGARGSISGAASSAYLVARNLGRAAEDAAYVAGATAADADAAAARAFDDVSSAMFRDIEDAPTGAYRPMWPEGPPHEWPDVDLRTGQLRVNQDGVEDSSNHLITLRLDIPDDASEEDIARFTRELVDAMDDEHKAAGGSGLKIEDVGASFEVEPAKVDQS